MTSVVSEHPVRAATHTHALCTLGCLTCGRGTVVLCSSKRVLSTLCVYRGFGSTVRARGTKGLINKSNESINIQTALREEGEGRARHVGEPL